MRRRRRREGEPPSRSPSHAQTVVECLLGRSAAAVAGFTLGLVPQEGDGAARQEPSVSVFPLPNGSVAVFLRPDVRGLRLTQ